MIDEGDHATVVFHRTYRHRPEHVWGAISTPEGLRGWLLCSQATIEGRVGGRIEMVSGPSSYVSTGRILEWDPPRVLEYEWNVAPLPEMPHGEQVVVRYELTRSGDATDLVVTYRRLSRHTAIGFLPGVHTFLERLEAQLDGVELPDWHRRFGELTREYPEWREHAPDPGQ